MVKHNRPQSLGESVIRDLQQLLTNVDTIINSAAFPLPNESTVDDLSERDIR